VANSGGVRLKKGTNGDKLLTMATVDIQLLLSTRKFVSKKVEVLKRTVKKKKGNVLFSGKPLIKKTTSGVYMYSMRGGGGKGGGEWGGGGVGGWCGWGGGGVVGVGGGWSVGGDEGVEIGRVGCFRHD